MEGTETVPTGLRNAHRIADRVWGLLVVHSGALQFIFEDSAESAHEVVAGENFVIPPGRPHHLSIGDPVTFVIEFHRQARPSTESEPV